jgi:tetratricopeptide (TPR) repeat protein
VTSASAGGPGWRIDPQTLLPEITDLDAFRAGLSDDPCQTVLVELWSGKPRVALQLVSAMLVDEPEQPRLLALRADCLRDIGDIESAHRQYETLIAEHSGTDREAVLVQHLGKTLFVAGRYAEAADCFERALALRRSSGADEGSIASSELALARARELAGQ